MNILNSSSKSAARILKFASMLFVAAASLAEAQNTVVLSWTASPSTGVAGYNVYRGSASGGPYTLGNSSIIAGTSFTDSTVQGGVTYYYVTTAVDALGNQSVYSVQAQAITPAVSTLVCSPTSINALAISTCTVTLSQAAPSAGSSVILSDSNIAALTIPASIAVAGGASSATFAATAATFTTNLSVGLTATLNGTSKTATLNLVAPAQGSSISGTISPTAGGSGATVTLSGAASATTTANASGNYTFSGLANGAYTVMPSKTGYTFAPASQAVTVNGVNQTAINFTATAQASSSSISGTISPTAGGSGATVTLSGAAGATTTADASGHYTFSGLANGGYTVTPSNSGYTFTPANQAPTLSGTNLTSVNFTAIQNQTSSAITVDVQVRQDQSAVSSRVSSPTFSTVSSNELLLAFIAAGQRSGFHATVRSVFGAGLTWVFVGRTQTQRGTSEIWRAFSPTLLSGVSVSANLSRGETSSMTVMSFAGVDTSGTNGSGAIGAIARGSGSSGAPTATLLTTRNNSLVVGVGNDPTNAMARTPGPGQILVHQYLVPGNTYWVQTLSSPTALSGSSVTINDSAPAGDPYNLSIAEILAAPALGAPGISAAMTLRPMSTASGIDKSTGALILSNLSGLQATNACSPGGRVVLTGAGLTTETAQTPTSFPLPLQLAGVRVLVNGVASPLFFASDSQVTFQCPLLPPGTPLDIRLEGSNGLSRSVGASVMREAAPELFTLRTTNQGGESLTIYANGLGEVVDGVPAGTPAPAGSRILLKNRIRVAVGGVEIEPVFAGLAADTVGLFQVDVKLPQSVPAGPAVPLYVKVILSNGTVIESNEVTVAIGDTTVQ